MKRAVCISCGCDDNHACVDGLDRPCHWLEVDRREGVGVCSACPDALKRWRAGDRVPLSDGPEAR